MPNHVTNKLTIHAAPEVAAAIFAAHITGEGGDQVFDFNTIIPMPEVLKGLSQGFSTIDGERVAVWRTEFDAEGKRVDRKLTPEEMDAVAATGATSWYDWACDNWGTKWNSYDLERRDDPQSIYFDTAWSPPIPVVAALAEKYPDVVFELSYFDEGWNFAGSEEIKAGERVSITDLACSKDSPAFCAMCIELKGYDPSKEDEDEDEDED